MSPRSRRPEDLLKGVVDEPASIKIKKKPDSIWWKALGRNKKVLILPIVFLGMTFTVVTMQLTAPKPSRQDAVMAISDSVCSELMTRCLYITGRLTFVSNHADRSQIQAYHSRAKGSAPGNRVAFAWTIVLISTLACPMLCTVLDTCLPEQYRRGTLYICLEHEYQRYCAKLTFYARIEARRN
ncbi:hypothetical protein V1515DRAFT_455088 [Lipomyces mesembrius]